VVRVLGVDNVLFAVGDLDAARRFYGEVLGLPVKFDFTEHGIVGFGLGDEEPGLVLRQDPDLASEPPRATPRVWLEVPDARKAAEELEAVDVTLAARPFEVQTGWTVEIADDWGNVLGLTDYTKAPDRARRPEA